MPLARAGSTRIWYDVSGDGPGAPVILVMGLGVVGDAWAPQILGLQGRHSVAWLDNRGVGRSDAPLLGYTTHTMARDVVAVLDSMGWGRAHVVGLSLGGMIAQHVGLEFPERTRSLTLIATHPGGPSTLPPSPTAMRLLSLGQFVPAERRWRYIRHTLFPRSFIRDPANAGLLETAAELLGLPDAVYAIVRQTPAVLRHRAIHRLPQLQPVPTLVVRPGRDLIIHPRESDRIHLAIPGSRLVRFDDAGHGVTAQCAVELNERLMEHFALAERSSRRSAA